MEQFQQILLKYNWPSRTEERKTSLKEIEEMIGFNLPYDYNMFIQKYFGYEEFIGKEYVRLWDADELMEQNLGYDIIANLPMTIGIGGNGASECIAIEMKSKNNYRIVLTPFIDLDKQNHIEIGSSFTDFLERLDNGKEWFKLT